jgi:peroxiredoxin
MKIRWMVLAIALALAMTALAALSTRSTGHGPDAAASAGGGAGGAMTASAAGCPAAPKPANLEFTLKDMYGRDVKLSDYRGKVVLLNFWATWCQPCLAEMPGFVQLQAKYKQQGLEVVGVSVSDAREDLPPFARTHEINYTLLVGQDHDELMNAYDAAAAIPVSVIIGRNGTICDRHMGIVDLEQIEREIKALL